MSRRAALRKEPQRRHISVEQLAEGIRRHLGNLPVVARQDTIGYRTSKFLTRHRSSVAAFIAVFLILVVGLAITTYEIQVVRQEESLAEQPFNEVRELAGSLLLTFTTAFATCPGRRPHVRSWLTERLSILRAFPGRQAIARTFGAN
jgi:hypothetical protein